MPDIGTLSFLGGLTGMLLLVWRIFRRPAYAYDRFTPLDAVPDLPIVRSVVMAALTGKKINMVNMFQLQERNLLVEPSFNRKRMYPLEAFNLIYCFSTLRGTYSGILGFSSDLKLVTIDQTSPVEKAEVLV